MSDSMNDVQIETSDDSSAIPPPPPDSGTSTAAAATDPSLDTDTVVTGGAEGGQITLETI